MGDTPQKQAWERQEGEPLRYYRRFLKYRSLGPERSVRKACDIAALPRKGRKPSWQYWRKLAEQWHWRDRAQAFDVWQNDIRQKKADELAVETAIQEAEQLEVWRRRQLEATVAVQEAGIQVFARLLELVKEGKVKDLPIEDVKLVEQSGSDGSFDRKELMTKGIAAWLPVAIKALAEGQRMEALARGLPTDRTLVQNQLGDETLRQLAEIIRDVVPPAEWEQVGARIDQMLRSESDNGKP